jgi:uncharacterized protein (TIGR02145 family)
MKYYIFLFGLAVSLGLKAQIQHNINTPSGTICNPISEIDSILFNSDQGVMEVILIDGSIESRGINTINNVTFNYELTCDDISHSCGATCLHNPDLTYGSLIDQGGNEYKTIVIGTQEWMAENLKTDVYRNGDQITYVIDSSLVYQTSGAWYYPYNNNKFDCPFGKMYNGYAVEDTRNLCPIGWHVPTNLDWNILIKLTDPIADTSIVDGFQSMVAGERLRSGGDIASGMGYWGAQSQGTNESGFSALPGGYGFTSSDFFPYDFSFWSNSAFASSTQSEDSQQNPFGVHRLEIQENSIWLGRSFSQSQFYIRCIKDEGLIQGFINNLDCSSAIVSDSLIEGRSASNLIVSLPYNSGNGGTHNGQIINSTGVIGLYATLSADYFSNGNGNLIYKISGTPSTTGIASFSLNIGGQSCELNLEVYSNNILTDVASSCGASFIHNPDKIYGNLLDQEGNEYKTITIGTQEWMAENLKTTIYSNGDNIYGDAGFGALDYVPCSYWSSSNLGDWCNYNFKSQYDCPFGKLYSGYVATDPRNICPTGWHVPTDSEWNILIEHLDPNYNPNAIGIQSFTAGGKLKSTGTNYWTQPNNDATNESGFSGLSTGTRSSNINTFINLYNNASWWSSSVTNGEINGEYYYGWNRNLIFSDGTVSRNYEIRNYGSAIRCIRD